MASEKVFKVMIDGTVPESLPDKLVMDQLRLEMGKDRIIRPGGNSIVKLTVKNYSSLGRMAIVTASFDGNLMSVSIPHSMVYIAPGGATAIYAVISTFASSGVVNVTFGLQ